MPFANPITYAPKRRHGVSIHSPQFGHTVRQNLGQTSWVLQICGSRPPMEWAGAERRYAPDILVTELVNDAS